MDIDSPSVEAILAPGSRWLRNHDRMMESTTKVAPRFARALLVPNPQLRLRELVHEVMRFKQYSVRTEEEYWNWMPTSCYVCVLRSIKDKQFYVGLKICGRA